MSKYYISAKSYIFLCYEIMISRAYVCGWKTTFWILVPLKPRSVKDSIFNRHWQLPLLQLKRNSGVCVSFLSIFNCPLKCIVSTNDNDNRSNYCKYNLVFTCDWLAKFILLVALICVYNLVGQERIDLWKLESKPLYFW